MSLSHFENLHAEATDDEPMFGDASGDDFAKTATTIEIALDPELLSCFCRRGRRRLREIQSTCKVVAKLDRRRSILRVSGSTSAIQAVHKQLPSLCGSYRPVPVAVWAELMRTRTLQDSADATVQRLQEESGCRIHIERSRHEVRVFGPKEGVVVADRLLQELAVSCVGEAVQIDKARKLDPKQLECLARSGGVTFQASDDEILVLGQRQSVEQAAEQLRKYIQKPHAFDFSKLITDNTTNVVPFDGQSSEVSKCEEHRSCSSEGSPGKVVYLGLPAAEHCAAGAVKKSAPLPQPCQQGAMQEHNHEPRGAISCGKGSGKGYGCPRRCEPCPTCGVGRFCFSCGAPILRVDTMNSVQHPFRPPRNSHQRSNHATHNSVANFRGESGCKQHLMESQGQMLAQPQNSWVPLMQVVNFDGSMRSGYGSGQNNMGMFFSGVVPVCVATTVSQSTGESTVHNGAGCYV